MAKSRRNHDIAAAQAPTTDSERVSHPKERRAINIQMTQEAIDRHWIPFPAGARDFIMKTPARHLNLQTLIGFWSSPQNCTSVRGLAAGCVARASFSLALAYLKMGMTKEAQSLTIHGSFLYQCCIHSSIESIISLCDSGDPVPQRKLQYFRRGVDSIRSLEVMESLIKSYLPPEDAQPMTSCATPSDKSVVREYIDQISDNWKGTSSAPRRAHRPSLPTDHETPIKLILVNSFDEEDRHSIHISPTTALKALFNDYSHKRGISLRSLRFSYMGETLFLSSAGRKTPEELGMRDENVIVVHDATQSSSSVEDRSPNQQAPISPLELREPPEATAKGKKKSTTKEPTHKSKELQDLPELGKTLDDYKVEHSNQLTKIHGEVEDQLKQIRQRLNNLSLERSQPKIKSKRPRSTKKEPALPFLSNNPFEEGPGGKAGKSRYTIQVGEVKNLYKTTKPSAAASHNSSSRTLLALDLHGCTREEALSKLDDTLKVWVDTAMHGSYPFVLPATIVCGCGNQVLRETVQKWIRSNDKVSNSPKARSSKR